MDLSVPTEEVMVVTTTTVVMTGAITVVITVVETGETIITTTTTVTTTTTGIRVDIPLNRTVPSLLLLLEDGVEAGEALLREVLMDFPLLLDSSEEADTPNLPPVFVMEEVTLDPHLDRVITGEVVDTTTTGEDVVETRTGIEEMEDKEEVTKDMDGLERATRLRSNGFMLKIFHGKVCFLYLFT
jgi:hypothetical protein